MATYSAPSGVLYRTHSPRRAITACPAATLISPVSCSTRNVPLITTVYSSKSGRCPGSDHPAGLRRCATLIRSPAGWSEPGQRPDFDEYTVVISGTLRVEHETSEI